MLALSAISYFAAVHESALGTKRTSACALQMSAFGGIADKGGVERHRALANCPKASLAALV
jgi:hypothetical protein